VCFLLIKWESASQINNGLYGWCRSGLSRSSFSALQFCLTGFSGKFFCNQIPDMFSAILVVIEGQPSSQNPQRKVNFTFFFFENGQLTTRFSNG
jgi:hypothetical protein